MHIMWLIFYLVVATPSSEGNVEISEGSALVLRRFLLCLVLLVGVGRKNQ